LDSNAEPARQGSWQSRIEDAKKSQNQQVEAISGWRLKSLTCTFGLR